MYVVMNNCSLLSATSIKPPVDITMSQLTTQHRLDPWNLLITQRKCKNIDLYFGYN